MIYTSASISPYNQKKKHLFFNIIIFVNALDSVLNFHHMEWTYQSPACNYVKIWAYWLNLMLVSCNIIVLLLFTFTYSNVYKNRTLVTCISNGFRCPAKSVWIMLYKFCLNCISEIVEDLKICYQQS